LGAWLWHRAFVPSGSSRCASRRVALQSLGGEIIEEKSDFSVFDRLDLYDLRRRCASFISQFISEFNEFRLELIDREYQLKDDFIDRQFLRIMADLEYIRSTIEVRRGK
jgi:hypothetical protein